MLLPNPYGDLKMDCSEKTADGEITSNVGSSLSHTPGPWVVESFGSPRVIATDHKGPFPVCDVRGWGHLTGKGHGALGLSYEEGAAIQDANARLIAAAPEMLAALLDIVQRNEIQHWFDVSQAKAAIAKARSLPAI